VRVERVLAPNPGPYTGPGTNTYLVDGGSGLAVLDPGPVIAEHERAIVEAVGGRRLTAIVVTHTHPDHAPLANPLGRAFGVPVYGHAPGPEFDPDVRLVDGDRVEVGGAVLEVVHTPGHSEDHLCFRSGGVLFTGDHIMGGSSVMIDDLTTYLASLERLQTMALERLYPGHGEEMDRPAEVISWYLEHRRQREREVIAALTAGAGTLGAVVELVYRDVDPVLHPLAARSVAAHLRKLGTEGMVDYAGSFEWTAPVEWTGPA
jgi:glyoxylase-like metal-dependent hydrolase (beta-lactamase superfamily II)